MTTSVEPRPWRHAEVGAERLTRALELTVTDVLDTGVYAIVSPQSGDTHYVNLRDIDCPACDCGDHIYRERLCAHALAAMLFEEDPRLERLVGRLVRRAWLEHRLVFAITEAPLGGPGATAMTPRAANAADQAADQTADQTVGIGAGVSPDGGDV